MKYAKILSVIALFFLLTSAAFPINRTITLYPLSKIQTKLVPVTKEISFSNSDNLTSLILDELLKLQKNPAYINILPENITVSQKGTTALVNLTTPAGLTGKNKTDCELFTIYSLVNSLTSTGEIITVEFTVDGKKQKDFIGQIDMRETFIPDYDICS